MVCRAGPTGQLLRLNRLVHVWRLKSVHWQEAMRLGRLRRLLLLWIVFLLLAHCVACCWWAIGNAPFNNYDSTGYQPWVHPSRLLGASGAAGTLDPEYSSLAMRYWTCMYWALTTCVTADQTQGRSVLAYIHANSGP